MRSAVLTGLISLLGIFTSLGAQQITDTVIHDSPHFAVHAQGVTWLYDKEGGGFSSLIDTKGNDWISFHPTPLSDYPESAAAGFRGMPNLVFGGEESGAGHPGHKRCHSVQSGPNRITSFTADSSWLWHWKFHENSATLTVDHVPKGGTYWFLYEGTPGGAFAPDQTSWGTEVEGNRSENPDYYRGEKIFEQWQGIWLAHANSPSIFYLIQHEPDTLSDLFSWLGASEKGIESSDGMTVFGFGRAPHAIPLLSRPHRFTVGFFEKSSDSSPTQTLKNMIASQR